MATTLIFPDPARDWIIENLSRGCALPEVVDRLVASGLEPAHAGMMVSTVSRALLYGMPMPAGQLEVEALAEAEDGLYRPDPWRLPASPTVALDDREVRVLGRCERPHAAILGNVFDEDECAALRALAAPRLRASTVTDPASGKDTVARYRSSEGMFFRLMENPLLERLDRRLSVLMGLPVEYGEGLQILHYPSGAEIAPHFDYLMPTNATNRDSVRRSGQRISTMVVYLNDVPAGGETYFPATGLSVTPQLGGAVYFEYGNAWGRTDPASLHGSAAVRAGEKWVATKWMRSRPFVAAESA